LLQDVAQSSTARLREVRGYLDLITRLLDVHPPSVQLPVVSAKGLFFVHLYGVYEFTIVSALRRTLQIISEAGVRHVDCQPALLSLAFDAECESLASAGKFTKWTKRRALFDRVRSTDLIVIKDSLVPTDGRNCRYTHLDGIWKSLHIRETVLPRMELRGRIEELVEKRNAIAHGQESPSSVGSRFTLSELDDRYNAISEVCTYIVETFDSYLKNRHYLVQ